MEHFQNPHPILSSSGEESSEEQSIDSQQPEDFAIIKSSFIQQKSERDIVWELTSSNSEAVDAKAGKQERVSVSSLKQKFERKIAEVKGMGPAAASDDGEGREKAIGSNKMTKDEILNEIKQERKKTLGTAEQGEEDGLRIKYEHNLLSFENRDLRTKLDQANRQMIDMKKESEILLLELERERLDKEIMNQESLALKDETSNLKSGLGELISRFSESSVSMESLDPLNLLGLLEQAFLQNAAKTEELEVTARREKAGSQELLAQMDGFKQMVQYFEKELENFKNNEAYMQEEKSELARAKNELEQTLAQEREEYSAKVAAIQADITTILQLKEEEIARLKESVSAPSSNNGHAFASQLEEYEAKLHLYEGKMKVLSETVETLRKNESELKAAMSAKAEEYAKTLLNLEIERSQLQDENEELKTNQQINLGNKDFEMSKYIDEAKAQRKTCKELEARISELDGMAKELKTKLEECESTLASERSQSEQEKKGLMSSLEETKRGLEEESNARKGLELKLEAKQKAAEELTAQISRINEHKTKDVNELSLEQEKNTRLWDQINGLNEELKQCKLELSRKVEENQALQEKLEDTRGTGSKEGEMLRAEITALSESSEKLKKMVSALQNEKTAAEEKLRLMESEKLESEKAWKLSEERLRTEIKSLNEELKEFGSNFDGLKEEHAHLLKTFTTTKEALDKTERQLNGHQAETDEKIRLIQQDFQKSAEESSSYLTNELNLYKQKLETLSEEKSSLEDVLGDRGGNLEAKQAECDKLLEEIKLLKESNFSLKEQEVIDLRLSLQALESEKSELLRLVEASTNEKVHQQKTLSEAFSERQNLEGRLTEATAKFEALEKEAGIKSAAQEKKLLESEEALRCLREKIEEREKSYSEKEANFKSGLEALEGSLAGMQSDIEKYSRENAALLQDKLTLQQLCDIGRGEREKLLREIESVTENLLSANKEGSNALEALALERSARKELECKVADYEEKVELLTSQRASLIDISSLSDKLSEAVKMRDSYESKSISLSEELEKLKAQQLEAARRLTQYESDIKREVQSKEKLVEDNEKLSNELEMMKVAIEESLSRITQKDADYEELKSTFEQILDQKESALAEIADLRSDLQEQGQLLKEKDDAAAELRRNFDRALETKELELARNLKESTRKEEILKEYVEKSAREKKETESELQTLRGGLAAQGQKIAAVEGERDSLLKSLSDVQVVIASMEEKLQSYAQQSDKVRGENQSLRLRLGELEELLNQTNLSAKSKEEELGSKSRELQELKSMYTQLAAERETAGNARVQELARLKNENNEMRFSVENLLKERETLQNERLKSANSIRSLEASLAAEKETHNKLVSEKERLLATSLSEFQNSLKMAEELSAKKISAFEERNTKLERLIAENEKNIQASYSQLAQMSEKVKSLTLENAQLKSSEALQNTEALSEQIKRKTSELEEKLKEEAAAKKNLQLENNRINKQLELLMHNLQERDNLLEEMKNAMEAIDTERKEKERANLRATTERKTVSESYEHKLFLKDLQIRELQSKVKELEGKKAGQERLSVTGSARASERRLNKSLAPANVYTGGNILEVQEEMVVASFEEQRIEKEVRAMAPTFQSARLPEIISYAEGLAASSDDQNPMARPPEKLVISKREQYSVVEIMGDVNIQKEKVILLLKKFERALEKAKREKRGRPYDEAKEEIKLEIREISSNYLKIIHKYFDVPSELKKADAGGQSEEDSLAILQALAEAELTMQSEKDQEFNATVGKINDFLIKFLKSFSQNQDSVNKTSVIPEEDHPSQDQRRSVTAPGLSQSQAPASREELRQTAREAIFKQKYKALKKTSTEGIEMFCKKCEEFKPCVIYEYHSCINNPGLRKLKNGSSSSRKQLKDVVAGLGQLVKKFEGRFLEDLKGDAILKSSWEKLRGKLEGERSRQDLHQIRRVLEEIGLFGDGVVKQSGLKAFLKRFEIIYEKLSEESAPKMEEEGILLTPETNSSKYYQPLRIEALLSD